MKNSELTARMILIIAAVVLGQGNSLGSPQTSPLPDTPPMQTKNEADKWEVGWNFTAETLNHGYASWYSAQLQVKRRFESGQDMYGTYRETSRFALRDREATFGWRQPFKRGWATTIEASVSPTHQVLPKWSALAQLERVLGRGWVAQVGFRHSRHNQTAAHLGVASLERYFGRYRVGYTLYAGAAENTGVSTSHRVAGDYYYGERSMVGAGFAAGQELSQFGARNILRSAVRDLSVYGRHYFNARWNLNYSVTWHEQGQLYTRRGINVGLQYRF